MKRRVVDQDEFRRMWAEGHSVTEICDHFLVGERSLTRLRVRMGLPTRRPWRGGSVGVRRARLKSEAADASA